MNKWLSKYGFYYPVTLLKGEFHFLYHDKYDNFQWASREKIESVQLKYLKKLLLFVINRKPYYKSLEIGQLEIQKASTVESLLHLFPILTKSKLINNLNDLTGKRSLFYSEKTTGGSTGEPVVIYKDSSALARERVATARSYEWANIQLGDHQARFWGIPHTQQKKLLANLIDIIANRTKLSAFDISDSRFKFYFDLLNSKNPDYIYGYVSVIRLFTQWLANNKLPPIKSVKSIVTTSEVLSVHDRKLMESYWGIKVYNEYGCGEVGSIAHECEDGSLHLMDDNLVIMVESNNKLSSVGTGELVVTDLHNFATPLVNYRLGDFGTISADSCSCGRTLRVLSGIHGRAYDIIKTPEGKSIHPEAIIYIFEDIQSKMAVFKQFQVIQTHVDKICVNIIPSLGFTDEIPIKIEKLLHEKISDKIKIEFKIVAEIKREKSGKLRLVKSSIN